MKIELLHCTKLLNSFLLFLEQNQKFLPCPAETFMIMPPSPFPVFPYVALCLVPHLELPGLQVGSGTRMAFFSLMACATYGCQCPKHPFCGSTDGWHVLWHLSDLCLNAASPEKCQWPADSKPTPLAVLHHRISFTSFIGASLTAHCYSVYLFTLLLPILATITMWIPSLFLAVSPARNTVPGTWMNEVTFNEGMNQSTWWNAFANHWPYLAAEICEE